MDDLRVFTTVDSLRKFLIENRVGKKVSLVPTMGALHHGHMELVKEASRYGDFIVVSIFVNPTQFNKQEDLQNYPRMLEKDIQLLSQFSNVIVFAPSVEEVYPSDYEAKELDLLNMDREMEGKFRPGHFRGVVNVVKRLFDIVEPEFSFFGEKDYQQLAIIKFMARSFELPVHVIGCETVREESGLASSSRNYRLSKAQWEEAEIIYKTMSYLSTLMHLPLGVAKEMAIDFFNKGTLELEYFELIDPDTLEFIDDWKPGARVCMAAYCDGVRLIDNMEIVPVKEMIK